MASMPAWATGWTIETIRLAGTAARLMTTVELNLLAEITETIIPTTLSSSTPKTEIPGAKALNVPQFIEKMVADCYDDAAQKLFRKGLSGVDEMAQTLIGKPFLEGNATQRLDVLRQMGQSNDATQKGFVSLVKNLTIRGYMTSEYVMTNVTHYEMAPARYKGCVPA